MIFKFNYYLMVFFKYMMDGRKICKIQLRLPHVWFIHMKVGL